MNRMVRFLTLFTALVLIAGLAVALVAGPRARAQQRRRARRFATPPTSSTAQSA